MLSLDKILATSLIATGMTLAGATAVFAQSSAPGNPSTQQMIDQLKPHTRGLIIGGGSAPPPASPSAGSASTGMSSSGNASSGTASVVAPPPPPVTNTYTAPSRPASTATASTSPTVQATPVAPSRPLPSATATTAPSAAGHPSLNLRVLFAFNSADLTPEARTTLDNLGRALQSNELKNSRFEVAGHTDAVGADDMNKKLSEERAAAVKNYLVTNYGIDASRIQSVGMGKADLVDPVHPASSVNRRVQVTNLSAAG